MYKKSISILLSLLFVMVGFSLIARAQQYNEAPMLQEKVGNGELPPVDERLPEQPKEVEPVDEIGEYGGTLTRAWLGPGDHWGIRKFLAEPLIKFDSYGEEIIPNIAKDWEVSEDGKVYTFYLRKGMKWSDGHEFTADDIVYYYEDVLLNKELTPVLPDWIKVGGKAGKIVKADDYTVKYVFPEPYGSFLFKVATLDAGLYYTPKHYMKNFHKDYVSEEEINDMMEEEGYEDWFQFYEDKESSNWYVSNPDHPTLNAWKATNDPSSEQFIMERNPYFWKVDSVGNQLPYIDNISNMLVQDKEMITMKTVSGGIDFQTRHLTMSDYTLFMTNREKGGYRVLNWKAADGANPMIMFNLSSDDEVLRNLFNNDKFRKALSLGIKRDDINEIGYLGQAEPRQASLPSGVAYYSEEWEKAYADYDPEQAAEMLDNIGLGEKDSEGYRLRPDGKRLELVIEYTPVFGPWTDAAELVAKDWENLGIKVSIKSEDRSLFSTRMEANEGQVSLWYMDTVAPYTANPFRLVPLNDSEQAWAGPKFARWYITNGEEGERPIDEDLVKITELYDEMKTTIDQEKFDQLANQIVSLHEKNIWFIGTVGERPQIAIAGNDLKNVPVELFFDNTLRSVGNAEPVQFYIKK